MPAEYRINRLKRIVYSRAWGVLTDHDLADNRAALFADVAFEPELAQLYDLTDVTEIQVSSMALLRLSLTSRFAATARRAIVVSSDVAFGMARMYSILSGREELIQVFRDRSSALRWINAVPVQDHRATPGTHKANRVRRPEIGGSDAAAER